MHRAAHRRVEQGRRDPAVHHADRVVVLLARGQRKQCAALVGLHQLEAPVQDFGEGLDPTQFTLASVSADEQDVAEAILAGACGYLLKDRPYAEIVMGIRAAAAGQAPLSPRIAAMLIRRLRDRLASLDPTHQYIVTVRGHGIRLDNPAA